MAGVFQNAPAHCPCPNAPTHNSEHTKIHPGATCGSTNARLDGKKREVVVATTVVGTYEEVFVV
jgi:hypothetical protein